MLLSTPFANLALYFLNKFFPTDVSQHPHARPLLDNALSFHLRHTHVATSSAQVYFKDVPPELLSVNGLESVPPVSIVTSPVRTTRPPSLHEFTAARHLSKRGRTALLDWKEDEVPGPDVTRRETLLLLAKMTSNTYFVPGNNEWYNLTDEWNVVRYLFYTVLSLRALPPFMQRVLTFCVSGNACRMGARRRWLPRVCIRDRGQQHRGPHD
jgi:lipase ATG15